MHHLEIRAAEMDGLPADALLIRPDATSPGQPHYLVRRKIKFMRS